MRLATDLDLTEHGVLRPLHLYDIHYKVWDEITYSFQTLTVQPLKFGSGWVVSLHTILGVWLFIHTRIKGNLC